MDQSAIFFPLENLKTKIHCRCSIVEFAFLLAKEMNWTFKKSNREKLSKPEQIFRLFLKKKNEKQKNNHDLYKSLNTMLIES